MKRKIAELIRNKVGSRNPISYIDLSYPTNSFAAGFYVRSVCIVATEDGSIASV